MIEVRSEDEQNVLNAFKELHVPASTIGHTTGGNMVDISVAGKSTISNSVAALRDVWESTAFRLEKLQCAEECVAAEKASMATREPPEWKITYTPTWTPDEVLMSNLKVRVAVIREEGSNGDREMSAAIWQSGMEPWDVTMSDLLEGRASLDSFQGVVFVGGFSYADVLDSAKGWAGTIRYNERLWSQFQDFYKRPDTFSLGVCNGCQLMALLGWVPATNDSNHLPDSQQPRFVHNASGRFESRWSMVKIAEDSPAIMLRGMGGSQIGVWCAHGEGQAIFPDKKIQEMVESENLAPIQYCDPSGSPTEAYPFNPNGSPNGIAALCSPNGRHLAMMPHPERCFLTWQQPWYPQNLGLKVDGPGPWLKLFQNAREWCEGRQ